MYKITFDSKINLFVDLSFLFYEHIPGLPLKRLIKGHFSRYFDTDMRTFRQNMEV